MQALVSDELWAVVAPLLPRPRRRARARGGRPRVDDRAALTGIVFVLKSGLPWTMLPRELGCGSGVTCWRRLRDWQAAGVWGRLHRALLDRLGAADRIDWSRVAVDSQVVAAKRGARKPGPTRRTAANRAQSAMLFRTGPASRSR